MYIDPLFEEIREKEGQRVAEQVQMAWLAQERVECDKDLLYFTRFFFKAITGNKFIIGDHHSVIANELKRIENYELQLLSINIPPRFSKTELAAVNFIARGIGMNPAANYLYITASDDLRAQTSTAIRDIVTHPLYELMYPELKLKKDQNAKNLWRTTQRGGLKTCTIFGQITGFGAGIMKETLDEIRNFEGCIVLDDINKIDDTQSGNAISEKVTRVYFNTVISRKNSKDTPVINIQQRAGSEDITGVLMDHCGYNDETGKCKEDVYKFLVLPVVDKNNVPLWEWKHDLKDIEKLRTGEKTASTFETQYMQDVSNVKGSLFKKSEFMHISLEQMNELEQHFKQAAIDVADQGSDNYSMPWGFIIKDKIYIKEWIYNTDTLEINLPRVASTINKNRITRTVVESNSFGEIHRNDIVRLINKDFTTYGKYNTDDKHLRITHHAQAMRNRIVFLNEEDQPQEYKTAYRHFMAYKRNKKENKPHKLDAPDSIALLMFILLSPEIAKGYINPYRVWEYI